MTAGRFDHRVSGTPESVWRADPRLVALRPLPMPTPSDHVLVVAAHPDDETLGAGGLLHQAGRCGARVTVVVATDGEGSHPASPTHPPALLAAVRAAEVAEAVTVLAPGAAVHHLGLPDGGLAARGDDLAAALRTLAPDATLVVTPWSGDRHPDHTAAAVAGADLAARLAVPHLACPIWLWHWAAPDDPAVPWDDLAGLALSATDLVAKSAAVRRHRSQVEALSDAPGDEAVLPPDTVEHFLRRVEPYVVTPAVAGPAHFAELYRRADDPWGLGSRFYEQRKREALLAALPRPRFARAFEPGCATGLLTARLAERCDEVVAWDVAAAAVDHTRSRVRTAGTAAGVTVALGSVPDTWPDGRFDLVVLSEVGYYASSLPDLVARATACLTADGVVVGLHWRHPAPAHRHTADAVHEAFGAALTTVVSHVEEDFLLHVWGSGAAADSVARREGLLG